LKEREKRRFAVTVGNLTHFLIEEKYSANICLLINADGGCEAARERVCVKNQRLKFAKIHYQH
jgi:hypothetical protein